MTDLVSKWKWKKGQVIVSQCAYCTRKQPGARCQAFPQGIPAEILQNRFDHRLNYVGDNGLTFEARKGAKHPNERSEPA